MSTTFSNSASATDTKPTGLSIEVRIVLSILILWHVLAVFVPPFTFSTSGMRPGEGSPVALTLIKVFRPYVEFTFLNHGYAFFAPDPGPNHLIRAHLEYADGRPGEDLIFPNLKQQWPRLLYHRHFMLTESLHSRYAPPSLPPEVSENSAEYKNWKRARELYDGLWHSYEKHLAAAYGASSAVLTRIEHRQPLPDEFERTKDPIAITDPRLSIDLPESLPLQPPVRSNNTGPRFPQRNVGPNPLRGRP